MDKHIKDYIQETYNESNSTRDVFKERSMRRYGYKDEYKTIFTTKISDKSSYCEY